MVLKEGAMERGLAHGQIYKTEFVDMRQLFDSRKSEVTTHINL